MRHRLVLFLCMSSFAYLEAVTPSLAATTVPTTATGSPDTSAQQTTVSGTATTISNTAGASNFVPDSTTTGPPTAPSQGYAFPPIPPRPMGYPQYYQPKVAKPPPEPDFGNQFLLMMLLGGGEGMGENPMMQFMQMSLMSQMFTPQPAPKTNMASGGNSLFDTFPRFPMTSNSQNSFGPSAAAPAASGGTPPLQPPPPPPPGYPVPTMQNPINYGPSAAVPPPPPPGYPVPTNTQSFANYGPNVAVPAPPPPPPGYPVPTNTQSYFNYGPNVAVPPPPPPGYPAPASFVDYGFGPVAPPPPPTPPPSPLPPLSQWGSAWVPPVDPSLQGSVNSQTTPSSTLSTTPSTTTAPTTTADPTLSLSSSADVAPLVVPAYMPGLFPPYGPSDPTNIGMLGPSGGTTPNQASSWPQNNFMQNSVTTNQIYQPTKTPMDTISLMMLMNPAMMGENPISPMLLYSLFSKNSFGNSMGMW